MAALEEKIHVSAEIEGVSGNGDKFMVGEQDKLELPAEVIESVNQLKGENKYNNSESNIIVHGSPLHYEKVFVKDGLDSF